MERMVEREKKEEKRGESLGNITIKDEALMDLAGLTCTRCYGIVGMASQSFHEGVAELLGRESLRKGVRMRRDDGKVSFSLYVIVEAGVNITEVAHNLIDQVKYMVESSTGIEVEDVQVHVQGVREA
jgi:uncharacterized alkaline shock family protein YloU